LSDSDPRPNSDDKLKILRGEKAKKYPLIHVKNDGDVGFDLIATEDTLVNPGAHLVPVEIDVDMKIKLPKGTAAVIWPRSGTHSKYPGLVICQAPIDNGYTGPIGPRVKNLSHTRIVIKAGTAIAQLVIYPIIVPEVVEVDSLEDTDRGEDRFGSTGE